VGLTTNVQFLRHVLKTDSFKNAKLDTALITREEKQVFAQEPLGLSLTVAAVVAHTLHQEVALQSNDPFSQRDGWRAYGVATRRFDVVFHDQAHTAVLTYGGQDGLHLQVGDISAPLAWRVDGDGLNIEYAKHHASVQVFMQHVGADDVAHVFAPQGATQITVVDILAHAAAVQEVGGRLTAPMPGKVVSFAVKAGDKVKAGQALAVMEAMKMEHTMAAPADGEVMELLYAPGDQVNEGAELLKLKV
jgi:3-methylcrotonyl-CoA carboxylase alpha subunit